MRNRFLTEPTSSVLALLVVYFGFLCSLRYWPSHLTILSAMNLNDYLVLIGDVLVVVGFIVTLGFYRRQRHDSTIREIDSTLDVLYAVRVGMTPWSDLHFKTGYDERAIEDRAELDFNAVMNGSHFQNFRVPTEPLVTLIEQPGKGWRLDDETIKASNVALWQLEEVQPVSPTTDGFQRYPSNGFR